MLRIDVQALPGANIGKAINEAKELATHLKIMVGFSFNGVFMNIVSNSITSTAVSTYLDKCDKLEQENSEKLILTSITNIE